MRKLTWTAYRVGETGFAGGFDVYAVRDDKWREIASGLTKAQANLIASAPALSEALKEAMNRIRWLLAHEDKFNHSPVEAELERWDAALKGVA